MSSSTQQTDKQIRQYCLSMPQYGQSKKIEINWLGEFAVVKQFESIMEYEYGYSEGAIFRRSIDGRSLDVYRGNGRWAEYSDLKSWFINTQILPPEEAEAAIKRLDDLRK